MSEATKRLRVTLTEKEAAAIWIECRCCSMDGESFDSAKTKLYNALVKAGHFQESPASSEGQSG